MQEEEKSEGRVGWKETEEKIFVIHSLSHIFRKGDCNRYSATELEMRFRGWFLEKQKER